MPRSKASSVRTPFGGTTCLSSHLSSSGSSVTSSDLPDGESEKPKATARRPPPVLRLPFDSRQRESHLVTDEEFDEIARHAKQDETVNLSHAYELGRSVSTARARRNRLSTCAPRVRPASYAAGLSYIEPADKLKLALENWQGELHKQQDNIGPEAVWREGMRREPSSFTALPHPPTKNDLAVYPSRDPSLPSQSHQNLDGIGQDSRPAKNAAKIVPENRVTGNTSSGIQHRRRISMQAVSASFVEAFKKHVLNRPPLPAFDDLTGGQPAVDASNHPDEGSENDCVQPSSSENETITEQVQKSTYQPHAIPGGKLNPEQTHHGNSMTRTFSLSRRKARTRTASSSTATPSVASTWLTTTSTTTTHSTPVPDSVLGFTPNPISNAAAHQNAYGSFMPSALPTYTKEQLHAIIVQQRACISNLELRNKCAVEQVAALQRERLRADEGKENPEDGNLNEKYMGNN